MASKPKASGTKKSPTSKANKKVQKTQSERFIEAARDLSADESGKPFEKTFKAVIRPKRS